MLRFVRGRALTRASGSDAEIFSLPAICAVDACALRCRNFDGFSASVFLFSFCFSIWHWRDFLGNDVSWPGLGILHFWEKPENYCENVILWFRQAFIGFCWPNDLGRSHWSYNLESVFWQIIYCLGNYGAFGRRKTRERHAEEGIYECVWNRGMHRSDLRFA